MFAYRFQHASSFKEKNRLQERRIGASDTLWKAKPVLLGTPGWLQHYEVYTGHFFRNAPASHCRGRALIQTFGLDSLGFSCSMEQLSLEKIMTLMREKMEARTPSGST